MSDVALGVDGVGHYRLLGAGWFCTERQAISWFDISVRACGLEDSSR
jgi:hypothetical protein